MCVVDRDIEWINVPLAKHTAAFHVQAVEDAGEIAQAVERGLAPQLSVRKHQIAATDFPVEPREIGVAVGLNLALDVARRGETPETERAIGVLVGKKPSRVAPHPVLARVGGLGHVERHQLDISHASRPAVHGARSVARRHARRHLAQDERASCQVCRLPEHLHQRRWARVVRRQRQQRGNVLIAQSNLELEAAAFLQRSRWHHADRHGMPAVDLKGQTNLGRRRFRPREQHDAVQTVGRVVEHAPVLAPGRARKRVRRTAA